MRKFMKGNEAVVIGALYAGCDVYFGYPITPASEIADGAAELFPQLGKEYLQAECETASINMIYGAASGGKLAMTASSGPGISLMQEGISYLAGAQLPALIVNIMRAGPGLGNIGPEQGDYNQAVKGGGHGNYHCHCPCSSVGAGDVRPDHEGVRTGVQVPQPGHDPGGRHPGPGDGVVEASGKRGAKTGHFELVGTGRCRNHARI